MGKNYIFIFSVAFAFKQTREHIVLKVQLLKMLNKKI